MLRQQTRYARALPRVSAPRATKERKGFAQRDTINPGRGRSVHAADMCNNLTLARRLHLTTSSLPAQANKLPAKRLHRLMRSRCRQCGVFYITNSNPNLLALFDGNHH